MKGSTSNAPTGNDNLTDKAKAAAGTASEEIKARARDAADTIASEAESYADQAKGAAADEVGGVASALRTAADDLRSGSPQERTFGQIADTLADASDAIRDKDLGEIMGSLNGFARKNPVIFMGTAALVGFAATRFVEASGSSSDTTQEYRPTQERTTRRETDHFAAPTAAVTRPPYGGQS